MSLKRIVLGLIVLFFSTGALASRTPTQTVDVLHNALVRSMAEGKTLGCAGRIGVIGKAVDSALDIGFISKHVLRKHWSKLTPNQQTALTSALRDMVITTYASQFYSSDNEKFAPVKDQAMGKDGWAVYTRLMLPGDDPVTFDYVLKKNTGEWRIVNIIAEGVSDMAIRSAQYDKVIKEKGVESLLSQIKAQNIKIKTDCDLAGTQP